MTGTVPTKSIWGRLIIGFISVAAIGAMATGYFIYDRFVATTSAFRDRTLQSDARLMRDLLERSTDGRGLELPDFVTSSFQPGRGKYAIIRRDGSVIASSPGVTSALAPIVEGNEHDFFLNDGSPDGRKLYGYVLKAKYGGQDAFIQVAVPSGELAYDSVVEEFVEDVGWIWIPFLGCLLFVNLLVARIGLTPLRTASRQADAIGPHVVSARLQEAGMPKEVYALVRAVNRAFDRLEAGYQSQRTFIADAAHELRTPVAVLKAHIALLPKSDDTIKLSEEVEVMHRLINQLLDSARLEAITFEAGDTAELCEIVISVAQFLGPLAISTGKTISVSAPQPIFVNGSKDWLSCAIRNIVENAIRHTPRGTSVEISVLDDGIVLVRDHGPGVPAGDRQAIFRRFWQGGRDRGGNAGLGLDIVYRIVTAHQGTVHVDDAPGGGAAFVVRIPKARSTHGDVRNQRTAA